MYRISTLVCLVGFAMGGCQTDQDAQDKKKEVLRNEKAEKSLQAMVKSKNVILKHGDGFDWKELFEETPRLSTKAKVGKKDFGKVGSQSFTDGTTALSQGNFREARKQLLVAFQLHPESFSVGLALAVACFKLGRHPESKRYMAVAEKRVRRPEELVRFDYVRGLMLLESKQVRQGRALLANIVERDPDFLPAYAALASSYILSKSPEGATFIIKRMEERFPKSAEPENLYGILALSRREYDRARRHFGRALDLKPDYINAKMNLATLNVQVASYDEAQHYLDEVLKAVPFHTDAYLLTALIRREQGRYEEARQALEFVLSYHPKNALVRYNLALLNWDAYSNFSSARRLFEEVVQLTQEQEELGKESRLMLEKLRQVHNNG